MTAERLLLAAAGCYLAALSASLLFIFNRLRAGLWDRLSSLLLSVGFVFQSAMIGLRWQAAGRPPFANMYEALVLFSWAVVLCWALSVLLYRTRLLTFAASFLAVFFLFVASRGDSAIKPLMPALQSPWMSVHVITYFVGYGALSLACMLGVMYLMLARHLGKAPQLAAAIEALSYRMVCLGFPFLTIGMTTGSMWANAAWGTYWNWDPKETCSLITWLVYIVYLHLRGLAGWQARRASWMLVIGFLATLFTFVGVNFILPGLHSYAAS